MSADRIITPTAEESKAIDEQIVSDSDDFELDDAWFEGAKTTQELFPEAYEQAVRQKEALKVGLIQRVNITLDRRDDSLVQGPDGGGRGDRRDKVAGAGCTGPPGPCLGQCRPEVTFAAYQGLIPPEATPRKRPWGRVDGPERVLRRPGGRFLPPPSLAQKPLGNARNFASVPKAWGSSRRR